MLSHLLLMANMDTQVMDLLHAGSYAALFGVLFLCGVGLPMPEDLPLLIAGYLSHTGAMHWGYAAIVAWCGIIGGDLVLYHIGKRLGPNVVNVPVLGRHINVKRLAQVERWFARYGIWVVAIGRMFAGVRGAMVVTAGTVRYPLWKFLIADGLAAIVSGGLFMWLGYALGENMPTLLEKVGKYKLWIGVIAAVLAAGGILWWWLRHRRTPVETVPEHDTLKV